MTYEQLRTQYDIACRTIRKLRAENEELKSRLLAHEGLTNLMNWIEGLMQELSEPEDQTPCVTTSDTDK